MGIDAVHLNGAMTGVQDYNVQHQEATKMMLDQSHLQNVATKKADEKQHQVQNKDDADKSGSHYDARDKGNGTYAGDGGMFRKKKESESDGRVIPIQSGGFDMKI